MAAERPATSAVGDVARESEDQPTGDIALRDVLALALARSPELAAFGWRVRAADAGVVQAGLLPNPSLDASTQDVGVPSRLEGQAEFTLELGQLIELGGKRAARIEQASRGRELAAWDYEVARIDVLARASQAFVTVLVAQQQLDLAEENVQLAQNVVDAVATRVRAGSTPTAELTKAEVARASARVERDGVRRALDVARRQLAATWGSTEARFRRARGDLERITPLPSFASVAARLDRSPDLGRWTTELLERRAAIDLEKSRTVPDVTARGGYRRLFDPGVNTFVVGLSVPLPIFDRNQGAIAAAESRLSQAREDANAARVRLSAALGDAYQSVATAGEQIATLRSDVIPGAREAFATLNAGYRAGRFSYLEVLDAQRTLIGARVQYVRALGDYHRSLTAVERLLGEPLQRDDPSAPAAGEE
ncbi:MAG TPA: TolC family protein [Candidatus Binatia bacterium]|nr:TolC family protein [Candidatus Binatia bacterium]